MTHPTYDKYGMRQFINLIEQYQYGETGDTEFDGIVYHNSNVRFDQFKIDPQRGVYFASSPDHDYGKYVYKCRVTLANAISELSESVFEIDRNILIQEGYDGRIVDYSNEHVGDDEMFDVIAFYLHQIEILEILDNEKVDEARNPESIKRFSKAYDSEHIVSDTHGQSARSEPEWKQTLINMMMKHDFSLVGNGINGAVFGNSSYPYVIKVYRRDHAYDEWLYFSRTHRNNKYVPKIKGKGVVLNQIFNAVRLEKLVPCPISLANDLISNIDTILDASMRISTRTQLEGDEALIERSDPDLVEIARLLQDWEGNTDLTTHNIMMRRDGSPVIIDPLYIQPRDAWDHDDEWEEGIFETSYYHGSQEDAPNFIIGHQGNNSNFLGNYSSKRYGVFLSNNPKFAQQYGKVGKYEIDTPHILPAQGVRSLVNDFVDSLDPFGEDRNIWLEARNVQSGAWPFWRMFEDDLGERFYAYVKDDYDAIEFEEYHDDDSEEDGSIESLTTVVLNPNVIKRVG